MAQGERPKSDDGLGPAARQLHAAQPWMEAVGKLTGGAAVGVLIGYFLDKWLGTTPWMLVGWSVLGIGAGFYGFLRAALQLGKK